MLHGTLIVNVSHRGVALETQQCLARCTADGARLISVVGTSDVALARNQALTRAVREHLEPDNSLDVVLLVDDDMVFQLSAARELVERARRGGTWSAVYATSDRDRGAAATRLDWNPNESRWMVGLGFCAFPSVRLLVYANTLLEVIGPNREMLWPFCQSAVVTPEVDGLPRWCSEDYWFSRALGGFEIAPVMVGHLKTVPLWPDAETVQRFSAKPT